MHLAGFELHLDQDRLPWRPTKYAGVAWFPLHQSDPDAEEPGDATVLIRMEPGSSYPTHRHIGVEEVLVLAGGYRDDLGEYRAGDYVRYPAGSEHLPVALGDPGAPTGPENPACLLFASARGGVENRS